MSVGNNDRPSAAPAHVALTTDRVTGGTADALAAALHAVGIVVERRIFLPTRDDVAHPWGVLLLAVDGAPVPLTRLVGDSVIDVCGTH